MTGGRKYSAAEYFLPPLYREFLRYYLSIYPSYKFRKYTQNFTPVSIS